MYGTIVRDSQLSAFPFDSPQTVENHLAQIVSMLHRLAPDLDGQDCVLLLGELALLRLCLEHVEAGIKHRVSLQAKRLGLLA